jgi:hypothetical protein
VTRPAARATTKTSSEAASAPTKALPANDPRETDVPRDHLGGRVDRAVHRHPTQVRPHYREYLTRSDPHRADRDPEHRRHHQPGSQSQHGRDVAAAPARTTEGVVAERVVGSPLARVARRISCR